MSLRITQNKKNNETHSSLVGGLREIPSTLRRTNRNPAFEIKTEYPSVWGRIDLSYLKYNSPDIEFYPLDDSSGTKQVELQVETMPNDQKVTLKELSNA